MRDEGETSVSCERHAVKKAVVDTSALIKAPLDEISKFSETLYTVEDVLKELRDKKTKHKLSFIPNYLKVVVPNEDSFKFVCEFSKKAGCYQSLSLPDLNVMALAHQLFVETYGKEAVRPEPTTKIVVSEKKSDKGNSDSSDLKTQKDDVRIPGFFKPDKAEVKDEEHVTLKTPACNSETVKCEETEYKISVGEPQREQMESRKGEIGGECFHSEIDQREKWENEFENFDNENDQGENWEDVAGSDEDGYENYDDTPDDEGDDSSWITKDNLKDAQKRMERLNFKEVENETNDVACVTLDYAMQRVLQQMGVTIMSVDGVKLGNVKSYVLRCFACMAKTPDLSKVFCPECGSKTLRKLFYSVGNDGTIIYHFSKAYVHNTRGFRFHAPRPQGGKHGQNPWVAEDQRFPRNQAPKKNRVKNLPLDPDYIANSSPFTTRDTHSRYFNTALGVRQTYKWMQRNPNENKGVKSKKR